MGFEIEEFYCIDTSDNEPIQQKPFRVPLAKRAIIDQQVTEMLKTGVITPSHSPRGSPVVLVQKKSGEFRFCVDFCRLNNLTGKYNWLLPVIDDILSSLREARYFSTLDLRARYWQVGLAEDSKDKMAFGCHKAISRFEVMPFGLTNAPSVFTELIKQVLQGIVDHT